MKKTSILLLILLSFALCLMLSACSSYDSPSDFLYDNTGEYNAIKIKMFDGNEAVYYLNYGYGVMTSGGETVFLYFDRERSIFGDEELLVNVITRNSYYKAIFDERDTPAPYGYSYYDYTLASSYIEISKDKTSARLTNGSLTMTKINVSIENIPELPDALAECYPTPDSYFEFFNDTEIAKLHCKDADFWIDMKTMQGEWSINGSVVPITAELSENSPYIKVFMTENGYSQMVLEGVVNVVDESKIEISSPSGSMFYKEPTKPLPITVEK